MVKPGPHRAGGPAVVPPTHQSCCRPQAGGVVSLGSRWCCHMTPAAGAGKVRRGTGAVRKVWRSPHSPLLSSFYSHHRYRLHYRHRRSASNKPVKGEAAKTDVTGQEGQGQASGSPVGMEEPGSKVELEQFMNTGRTGRRNAMPEIDNEKVASISTADLPLDMAKLTCTESGGAGSPGQPSQGSKPPGSKPS